MKPGIYHHFQKQPGYTRRKRCGESMSGGFHYLAGGVQPHAYRPKNPNAPWYRTKCDVCGGNPGETIHLLSLPGMETKWTPQPEPEDEPEPLPVMRAPEPQLSLFGGL